MISAVLCTATGTMGACAWIAPLAPAHLAAHADETVHRARRGRRDPPAVAAAGEELLDQHHERPHDENERSPGEAVERDPPSAVRGVLRTVLRRVAEQLA